MSIFDDTPPHGADRTLLCGFRACDPFYGESASALSITRFSTGQFVVKTRYGESIRLTPDSSISLFNYGIGDRPPLSTGYDDLIVAENDRTDCCSGGALVEKSLGFYATGLAARLGRPTADGKYAYWLDQFQSLLREVLAERVSVQLHYQQMGRRYRLGQLQTTGSIFGPASGEVETEEIPDPPPPHLFTPFRVCTVTPDTNDFSVSLNLSRDIVIESSVARMVQEARIEIPVTVWLFGYPRAMPMLQNFCGVPREP